MSSPSDPLSTLKHKGPPDVPPPARVPPTQFGRYRVVRPLGQGGMGTVYLAHDSALDRPVALKIPDPAILGRPGAAERFRREAQAAAGLRHPNLCPVYDVGEQDGLHYLTMAYIDGRPLSDLIAGRGPLPVREVVALVRTLALAMQEAHAAGVVHRDLKPSNVLITPKHEPVVTDFGLAKRAGVDPDQTGAGQVLGTPAYMSPEQARGDVGVIGPSSDVYSLGAILYELFAGRPPFTGSLGDVLYHVMHTPPDPPSRFRPGLDPGLDALCLRALAKEPADRPRGMAEFADALGRYLRGLPIEPAPAPAGGEQVITLASAATLSEGPAEPGPTADLVADLLARLDRQSRARRPSRVLALTVCFLLGLVAAGAVYIWLRPAETVRETRTVVVRLFTRFNDRYAAMHAELQRVCRGAISRSHHGEDKPCPRGMSRRGSSRWSE